MFNIRRLKQSTPCHRGIGACCLGQRPGLGIDATIHHHGKFRIYMLNLLYFIKHGSVKGLPPCTSLHSHNKHAAAGRMIQGLLIIGGVFLYIKRKADIRHFILHIRKDIINILSRYHTFWMKCHTIQHI